MGETLEYDTDDLAEGLQEVLHNAEAALKSNEVENLERAIEFFHKHKVLSGLIRHPHRAETGELFEDIGSATIDDEDIDDIVESLENLTEGSLVHHPVVSSDKTTETLDTGFSAEVNLPSDRASELIDLAAEAEELVGAALWAIRKDLEDENPVVRLSSVESFERSLDDLKAFTEEFREITDGLVDIQEGGDHA